MDAQDAIALAKDQVKTIFADEKIVNVGLEELDYDPADGIWKITVGFSRPWDLNNSNRLSEVLNVPRFRRTYKIVKIDDRTARFLSVSNRETEGA